MAELVNLRLAPDSDAMTAEAAPEAPDYPWGLRLDLDQDTLAKLALGELPEVGAGFVMEARAVVVAVGENQEAGEPVRRHLALQITDLALAPPPRPHADKLFGG